MKKSSSNIIAIIIIGLVGIVALGLFTNVFSGNSDDDGTKPPATKPTVTVAPDTSEETEETDSPANLMTFTIRYDNEDHICYAEEGMTWDNWIESDYNTLGVTNGNIDGDNLGSVYILVSYLLYQGDVVEANDFICIDGFYEC